jgi:hypothetical protein
MITGVVQYGEGRIRLKVVGLQGRQQESNAAAFGAAFTLAV